MGVLIISLQHGFIDQAYQFFTHHKIREALPKVDGIILNGQCAHGGENSSADMRQFAFNNWLHNNQFLQTSFIARYG